jgi:hypothetical protein
MVVEDKKESKQITFVEEDKTIKVVNTSKEDKSLFIQKRLKALNISARFSKDELLNKRIKALELTLRMIGKKFSGGGAVTKYHLGGDMSKHLAPNGKPSNLTHEQWHLVRTPEFIAWFGDWINDPKNASKVVDENGEPLVCYHGSRSDFTVFDKKEGGKSNSIAQIGFWFTPKESFARNFSENSWYGKNKETTVYSVFLLMKNPKFYKTDIVPQEDVIKLNDKIERLRSKNKKIKDKWKYQWEENQAFSYALQDALNEKNIEYYKNKTSKSAEAIADGYEVLKNNDKIRNIILIKGKTYQQELEHAKKKYTFDVEKFRSITSDESYILKISNIKLNTT